MGVNTPKEIFGPEFSKVDFLRIMNLKNFENFRIKIPNTILVKS